MQANTKFEGWRTTRDVSQLIYVDVVKRLSIQKVKFCTFLSLKSCNITWKSTVGKAHYYRRIQLFNLSTLSWNYVKRFEIAQVSRLWSKPSFTYLKKSGSCIITNKADLGFAAANAKFWGKQRSVCLCHPIPIITGRPRIIPRSYK